MKKLLAFSIVFTLLAGAVFAENGLAVSGDFKTGLNISKSGDNDPTAQVKNSDDAGTPGRVRLNFNYTKDNLQFKWRIQMAGDDQQNPSKNPVTLDDKNNTSYLTGDKFLTTLDNVFAYAYAMGDFFDNQFRMSLGKIDGDKPWETSGDEIWGSVETLSGSRFEFKPNAVKGLNVGFMLPAVYNGTNKAFLLGDYFSELRFGAKYENDALDARLGFQLDGPGDEKKDEQTGGKFVYRLNIKALGSIVPGLSLWANGQIEGIGTVDGVPDSKSNIQNWLYVKFAKDKLTGAALRLGLQNWGKGAEEKKAAMGIYIKPVFSYKPVSWAELGLMAKADLYTYEDTVSDDASMFDKLTIEPSVNFDLGNGASIKPVYTLGVNMANGKSVGYTVGDSRIDHTFELRFVYSF